MHAHIRKDTPKYKNIYANTPTYIRRYTNNAKIHKYMQMFANAQVFSTQIYANVCKHMQIYTNISSRICCATPM